MTKTLIPRFCLLLRKEEIIGYTYKDLIHPLHACMSLSLWHGSCSGWGGHGYIVGCRYFQIFYSARQRYNIVINVK